MGTHDGEVLGLGVCRVVVVLGGWGWGHCHHIADSNVNPNSDGGVATGGVWVGL